MRDVGIYFHIPFCERVCPYCDFAVVPRKALSAEEEQRYVAAVLAELRVRAAHFADLSLATVYFGGGTPSLLRPESLATLLGAVRAAFDGVPREVTLEVNPSTVERDRLPAFRRVGVDRLSIGVQSFDDAVLRRLGRAHRGTACDETLRAARAAGFNNLSMDLIFAAPGQDEASVARDLERALAHRPEHISAYTLTVEGETPFARAAAAGKLPLPEEAEGLAMLERVWGTLTAAGYRHYELSNFALPGFAAMHNRRYWERAPILALGVGACSFDPATVDAPYGSRPENPRALRAYYKAVQGNPHADWGAEPLTRDEAIREALFLALRTERGFDLRAFVLEFAQHPRSYWGDRVDALIAAELLEELPGRRWRLAPRGRRLADSVLLELL